MSSINYYQGMSNVDLNSTCSSQTSYNCTLATNDAVTSDMTSTPDYVRDKTVTVLWEGSIEISSGALARQDGDHMIKCYVKTYVTVRESVVVIKDTYHIQWISLNRTPVNQTSRLLLHCHNPCTRL